MSEELIKERIYNLCESEITMEVEKELAQLITPYKNGSIGVAQLNPVVGDIEYNVKKIVKYIRHAQNIGLDLIVFPALSLIGSPMGDMISRYPFLARENVKWLKSIAKITTKTAVAVGFIEPDNCLCYGEEQKFYNSIAILYDGKIQGIVRKSFIYPNSKYLDCENIQFSCVVGSCNADTLENFDGQVYDEFSKIIVINNKKYAFTNGEDVEIIDELLKENPDIIINCSSSPASKRKEQLNHELFSYYSSEYSIPLVYVNQVGAVDSIVFEGSSSVYNSEGELIAKAKPFEEQLMIVNPFEKLGKIYPQISQSEEKTDEENSFSLDYDDDLERTYNTLILGIKDYFLKTGFTRAVLGLSGGLDSTVCAVLLADALGKENVFGISMPSKITSDESKNDARELAQNLGIHFAQIPIKDMFESADGTLQELFANIEQQWDNRYKESYTQDNIQARSRATILWGVSNEFGNCLPIATSDKSESYVGYATINGDMSGGFAPIADVTKTKLFALARWMNQNRPQKNAIPESVILKKPGAELAIDPNTGKPLVAEDALMPYEFMDEIIWRIECKKENYLDMLDSEFLYEKKNKISKEQKEKWLNKFYRRMAGAMYKWSIFPSPIVVDECRSIGKYNYNQPISSSRVNYKSLSQREIDALINLI